MALHQAVNTIQKAPGSVDAFFAPFEIFFWRSSKERIEAPGVRAIVVGHFVSANHVAFGLGHSGAALKHHTLRKKPGDRLVMIDQAEVAHHFAPETRIQQVQDGGRYAPDVMIDWKP